MASRSRPFWALLLAVVLLGINLRMVIAGLPPLLPEVRRGLGLSDTVAGAVHDLGGSWGAALTALLGVTLLQLVPGIGATASRRVGSA
jgi:cyanate permease